MDFVFVSCVLGLIAVFYLYLTRNYSYWEKQGIPTVKGIVPGFGHMASFVFLKKTSTDLSHQFYNSYKDASMVGFYSMTTPGLFIREPALIKTVLQTNFSSFQNNGAVVERTADPLASQNPFFSTGEQWAKTRKRVSYAFSTMRLKNLTNYIQKVCEKLTSHIDRKLGSSKEVEIELKDLFSRFSADSVASAGVGLEGHSFEDDQRAMSFQQMGKMIFEPTLSFKITQVLTIALPFLNKIFQQSVVPKSVDRFLRTVIHELVKLREQENVQKNDFLELMMELGKTEDQKINEEQLAGDVLTFFMDGYETSSTTLAFVAFQIAKHPDVQDKLREEVKSVLAKHNGAITYDSLKEMTYMEQVISEAQRMNPVFGYFFKTCTQDTVLEGSDGLICKLKAGTPIMVPMAPIHNDPKYWKNPDVFDPDRFSEERKKDIEKFTFMPFGEGPRICLGMRVAWIMMKAALSNFLMQYSVKLSPRTRIPLKLSPGSQIFVIDGGVWGYIERL